jgi:hypothetical protein
MQLLKPKQISGEIMTLFEEAEETVIIISPYYKISKWHKLLNCLEDLNRRNIDIEVYVRSNEWQSIKELESIGLDFIPIPNLHTKLYLNEKQGIVSSMNMLFSSDTSSLDIGLKTQSKDEYLDLYKYYKRYIKSHGELLKNDISRFDFIEDLNSKLFGMLGEHVSVGLKGRKLIINGTNKYEVFIANERTNNLRISGILSQREFEYAIQNKPVLNDPPIKIEIIEGTNGYYNMIWGTVKDLKSNFIDELNEEEAEKIVVHIYNFISVIEAVKFATYI